MPQAAAAAVVSALGVTGTTAAVVSAIVQIVVTVAINYGLSRLAQSLSGKPKTDSIGAPRDITVKGTVEPMQMIYGEVLSPGFIANYATSGANNRFLHFVIVYAAHQCEDITDVWLDGQQIPDADIESDGEVTTAEFQGEGESRVNIIRYLGEKAQVADDELSSTGIGDWSVDHRGAGVAYIHYRLDGSDEAFPGGSPNNFRALIKGRRLYDPRKDSTNGGSGSHRYTDATTWEWSNNPALCRRDYIAGGSRWYDDATPEPRLGFGESNDRIDDTYVIASANIDDENVVIPPSSSPVTTQKRYTCDVQISCGDTYRENLRILESASVGTTTFVNGKYRIYSGAYDTPEVDLDEDDILGPVTVSTHPNGEDVYNLVTGTFYDEARDWQQVPFPNITNSSYETADGGQFPRKIELHATRTSYRAQRIGILHLAQSRNKINARFERLSPKAMAIAEHETFTVTISEYGWSQKVFRCLDWEFMPDGFIAITAREESSAAYADPSVGTYTAGNEATVDTPEFDEPVTPTNFEARSMPNGIAFRWDAAEPVNKDQFYRLYEHTSITPFSSATRVWSGKSLAVLLDREDYATRYYWVTSVLNGIESDETPTGNGLAAAWKGEDTGAFAVDAQGKPAGIVAIESITDRSQVRFGGTGIQILSTPNTTVGYGFPAIPIDASATYELTVRHKSSGTSSDGLYFRFNELNAALPSAKTHIGHNDGAGLASVTTEKTSHIDVFSNGAMPGTTMIESVYTYTPTAGTKFASFSIYNYDPATASVTHEVEWVRLVRTGSNVNLLAQGAYATDDIIPNAATDPFVIDEPADGSQAYSAVTQPQVEASGIGGLAAYTSPSNRATEVKVSWAVQCRISNTTSGIAVGTSFVSLEVTVNAVSVWESTMTIESYNGTDEWATFSGSRDFSVPANQEIKAFLNMGRVFTTGGASPTQTHFWKNALVNLKAAKA